MTTMQHVLAPDSPRHERWTAVLEVLAVAGAMMLAAGIRIPLPFSPVPVTAQTLVALLAGPLLGWRRGTAAMGLFLGIGAMTAPFIIAPFGATAGYLLAFLFTPWVVTRFRNTVAGMAAGTVCIYALGAAWLVAGMGLPVQTAVLAGVVSFLPGDVAKAALAAWLADRYGAAR